MKPSAAAVALGGEDRRLVTDIAAVRLDPLCLEAESVQRNEHDVLKSLCRNPCMALTTGQMTVNFQGFGL